MKTILLPNGYGSLKYLSTVEEALNRRNLPSSILNFPGQDGNPGVLTISTAASKLTNFLETSEGSPVNIIAHCSAAYAILKSANNPCNYTIWKNVSNVIIYSYLANPWILRKEFVQRATFDHNVTLPENSEINIDISPHAYEKSRIPFTIIHPKTRRNALRASQKDLESLATIPNVKEILQPEFGYEIIDLPQETEVALIVDEYYCKILL